MYLDHLYVREEVVAVTHIGDTLLLSLRWDWEDLPYLFTLPSRPLLRWGHLDDPLGGIPVRIDGWRWTSAAGGPDASSSRVELRLRLCAVSN